jgi:flavorubredoxin
MLAMYIAKLLKPSVKHVGLIILYAWGTNADKQLVNTLKELGIEIIDTININVAPTDNDIKRVRELTIKIAQR